MPLPGPPVPVNAHIEVPDELGWRSLLCRWDARRVRVLMSSTANEGHFGPLLPLARAAVVAGHEVCVAAPASFAPAVQRTGLRHLPFADAPAELIGPVMARLPS